jgi:hypothetical protein
MFAQPVEGWSCRTTVLRFQAMPIAGPALAAAGFGQHLFRVRAT